MVGEGNFNWVMLNTRDRAPAHTEGITCVEGEKLFFFSILLSCTDVGPLTPSFLQQHFLSRQQLWSKLWWEMGKEEKKKTFSPLPEFGTLSLCRRASERGRPGSCSTSWRDWEMSRSDRSRLSRRPCLKFPSNTSAEFRYNRTVRNNEDKNNQLFMADVSGRTA